MNHLLIKSDGLAMGTVVITPGGESIKGITRIVINPIEVGQELVTATITVVGVRVEVMAFSEIVEL